MSNAALLEISDTEQFATNLASPYRKFPISRKGYFPRGLARLPDEQNTLRAHRDHRSLAGRQSSWRFHPRKAKREKTSAETFQSALPITYEKVT